ncbi:MAG: zinc ribbon domain-containing protein [Clostridiales bacterium]|nr:zinc ribbon domain-containing protein [Clostridiales bacterium]
MSFDKTSLVRQLIPKSYHFDGYNMVNCPNSRDKPFFSDNVIQMGEYYLTTRLEEGDKLSIEFQSVCKGGKFFFSPYILPLDAFVEKLKEAIKSGRDFIDIEISISYGRLSRCFGCEKETEECINMARNSNRTFLAAISFNTEEVEEALAVYYEITNKKFMGGRNVMKRKNGFLGMNFELGMSKDANIASTLMGVAVKNPETGNWYTFDATKNTRKNIAGMKMGNFPIMLLPTKALTVGDLLKKDGKYYYVKAINTGSITLLNAADGMLQEMLPEESLIPGMTLYTKVVAFDIKTLTDPATKQNMGGNVLAAMCMMNWANGSKDEFSLDNINDESFNGLGSCLPMLMAMNGGDIGGMFGGANGEMNLPMLMMLGNSGESENNSMVQMLVLSQLLGNNSPVGNIMPIVDPSASVAGGNVSDKETVVCKKCGATYDDGSKFCSKCGGETESSQKKCRKCGEVLKPDALFCHHCGAKAEAGVCVNCGKHLDGTETFCPECGIDLTKIITNEPPAETVAESADGSKE